MAQHLVPIPAALPTKTQFRSSTGGLLGKRNRIRLIDNALVEWHKNRSLQNTIAVYKECRHWLKAKMNKQSGKTPTRRAEVNKLVAASLRWMRYLDRDLGRAFDVFQNRKFGRGAQAGTKSMSGVYQHERAGYLQLGKQRAPSASILDNQYFQKNLAQQTGFSDEFGDLTEQQFMEVDRITGQQHDVIYLRKMSRLRHMQMVDANGLLTGIDDQPTTTDLQFGWPYAMDKYGSVFTRNDQAAGGQFNHSSFNAGNDVVCAGFILINAGRLEKISNNSGHYKPSAQHLENAIRILQADGVGTNNCVVEFHDYVSEPGYFIVWEYNSVGLFMNRGAMMMGGARGRKMISRNPTHI